jgi:hypothetical protein
MMAEFFGSDEGSFYDFNNISKNRKIKYPWFPNRLSSKVGNDKLVSIPRKQNGEIRILSADIALMSSKKHNNDATSIFINQLTRTRGGRYISNFIYTTTSEGLRTEEQALEIRKLYDEYECDYIVLDTNGRDAHPYSDVWIAVRQKRER